MRGSETRPQRTGTSSQAHGATFPSAFLFLTTAPASSCKDLLNQDRRMWPGQALIPRYHGSSTGQRPPRQAPREEREQPALGPGSKISIAESIHMKELKKSIYIKEFLFCLVQPEEEKAVRRPNIYLQISQGWGSGGWGQALFNSAQRQDKGQWAQTEA